MFFVVEFAVTSFVYLILALQVRAGFPPLYGKYQGSIQEQVLDFAPFFLAMMVISVASIISIYFLALLGVVSVWYGLRVRHSVKNQTNGPRLWLIIPATVRITARWPMLGFDIWTVGLAAILGVLLISGS